MNKRTRKIKCQILRNFHAACSAGNLTPHLSYSPLPVQSFPTMWVLVLPALQSIFDVFHGAHASFLSCPGRLLKFKVSIYFGAVDLANTCIGALFVRAQAIYTRMHGRAEIPLNCD